MSNTKYIKREKNQSFDALNENIENIKTPTNPQDAVNKEYCDGNASFVNFKEGVATVGDLPSTGNIEHDGRIVNDTGHLYIWNGSSWIDQGDILDITWGALEDKPVSAVGDIDLAVTHKDLTNNPHAVTIDQLDLASGTVASDIDNAVNKAHDQNTDTILLSGGSGAEQLINLGILKTNLLSDDGINIQIDEIRARDGDGLKLYDDGGNGIFVEDGGNVGIGLNNPGSRFVVKLSDNLGADKFSLRDSGDVEVAHITSDGYGYFAGAVGIGGSSISKTILSLSSTTRGFLPPRMTAIQRNAITSPPTGLMLYDTTNDKLDFYDGSGWRGIISSPVSTLSAGCIPFATAGHHIDDDINLFWDNINKRLGIGTDTPSEKLDVNGNIQISGTGSGLTDGNTGVLITIPDLDDAVSKKHTQNTDTDFIRKDGTVPLLADWDIGGARKIKATLITARDEMGLRLFDNTTGRGIYIADEGKVYINNKLDVSVLADGALTAGYNCTATSLGAVALGYQTNATGMYSTSMGAETTASNQASTAMGFQTIASGMYSVAMGREIEAGNDYIVAIGLDDMNGLVCSQANTMCIMGGKVGIGTTTPASRLTVGNPHVNAQANNDITSVYKIGAYTPEGLGVSIGHVAGDYGSIYAYNYATWTAKNLVINEHGANVGIGVIPTAKLDIDSDILRLRDKKTPSSATDTGNAGDWCWDENYIYICVNTNIWKRSALSSW